MASQVVFYTVSLIGQSSPVRGICARCGFIPDWNCHICLNFIVRTQHGWLEIVGHVFDLLGCDADGPIEGDACAG